MTRGAAVTGGDLQGTLLQPLCVPLFTHSNECDVMSYYTCIHIYLCHRAPGVCVMPAVVINNTLVSSLNPWKPTYNSTDAVEKMSNNPTCQGDCVERSAGAMVLLLCKPFFGSRNQKYYGINT